MINLKRVPLLLLLLLLLHITTIPAFGYIVQEQVHLSMGANATEMLITWHSLKWAVREPLVKFGTSRHQLIGRAAAEVAHFAKIGLYTYRALLTNLKPLTIYYYKVGSFRSASWSSVLSFRSLSDDPAWRPKIAIFGDLGYQNAASLPYLEADVTAGQVDVIFHIGDIGYDLYERDGEQGNAFMRQMEKVASRVPYMTCPGNHERKPWNFSHYDARFSMLGDRFDHDHTFPPAKVEPQRAARISPRSPPPPKPKPPNPPLASRINNHYHSVDIGPYHIVLFNTEFYYYTEYGWTQIRAQYEWLRADLEKANRNRQKRPWIIVLGHRPLYCLKLTGDLSCNRITLERARLRTGVRMYGDDSRGLEFGLEELFFNASVDLQVYGHEHFVARFLPVYDHDVMLPKEKEEKVTTTTTTLAPDDITTTTEPSFTTTTTTTTDTPITITTDPTITTTDPTITFDPFTDFTTTITTTDSTTITTTDFTSTTTTTDFTTTSEPATTEPTTTTLAPTTTTTLSPTTTPTTTPGPTTTSAPVNPYNDPGGPIHITSGSAGNRELHPLINPLAKHSEMVAKCYYDYGYTRLRVLDRLTIVVEQVSVDQNGTVVDSQQISKSVDRPEWDFEANEVNSNWWRKR